MTEIAITSVLTIAGTDSSGGAGILADVKTFTSLGCYGSCVITALTAQNTTGVQGVQPSTPAFVRQQMKSVLDDIPIHGIKTGMLHDKAVIDTVVDELSGRNVPLVVDPVMVSTSGHTLLEEDAIDTLCRRLLPIATVVTPNLQETALLLKNWGDDVQLTSIEGVMEAALTVTIYSQCQATLVKGGHLELTAGSIFKLNGSKGVEIRWYDQCGPDEPEILRAKKSARFEDTQVVADVLFESGGGTTIFVRPRLQSKSTHGTGCTLSAALTCELAKGKPLKDAVQAAADYTHQGIATAIPIGAGHGPLNQLHPILSRVLPSPTETCPSPFVSALIRRTYKVWMDYVQHPFVVQLGKGVLPKENFLHFIKQDYHYLKHYARAYGLLAAKSSSFEAIGSAANTIGHIIRETSMHVAYCESWGISKEELLSTPESPATLGYTNYLLDAGLRGDDLTLMVALLACLLGYGEVGLWLKKQAGSDADGFHINGNPYKKWIEDYGGDDFQKAVQLGVDTLEAIMAANPPSRTRFEELVTVWERVVRLEIAFWDMGLSLS